MASPTIGHAPRPRRGAGHLGPGRRPGRRARRWWSPRRSGSRSCSTAPPTTPGAPSSGRRCCWCWRYPLCRWVAKKTGEPEIAGFLFGAAALKIVVGATVRYYMVDARLRRRRLLRLRQGRRPSWSSPFRQRRLRGPRQGHRHPVPRDPERGRAGGDRRDDGRLVPGVLRHGRSSGCACFYLAFCEAHPTATARSTAACSSSRPPSGSGRRAWARRRS